jgi:hypothetical protein
VNHTLARIVIDQLVFYDLSGEDAIPLDQAVRQTEGIVAALRTLAPPERDEFLSVVYEVAREQFREDVRNYLHTLATVVWPE